MSRLPSGRIMPAMPLDHSESRCVYLRLLEAIRNFSAMSSENRSLYAQVNYQRW